MCSSDLDLTDPNYPTVLIKLYDPLPASVNINTKIWLVEQVADSVAYNLQLTTIFEETDTYLPLRGPNFNLSVNPQTSNTVPYRNELNLNFFFAFGFYVLFLICWFNLFEDFLCKDCLIQSGRMLSLLRKNSWCQTSLEGSLLLGLG